jgi:hypothetical protein
MKNTSHFSDELWLDLVGQISSAFSMKKAEAGRLAKNRVAKLIAALPYLAGSGNPRRSALSHLATFLLAKSEECRKDFDHCPEDDRDVLARLATGAHFEGGDAAIIGRGMKILAIVMIAGYLRDLGKDDQTGAYNPVGSRKWDAEARLAILRSEVAALRSKEMDAILPVDEAVRSWWDA